MGSAAFLAEASSHYERPPAPAFDLSPQAAEDDPCDSAVATPPTVRPVALHEEESACAASDDGAAAEDAVVSATRVSLEAGPLDDDVLGATLESVSSPLPPTRPEGSRIETIEAAEQEPLEVSQAGAFFREGHETLAPVVEELDERDDEPPPPSMTPAQRQRQRRMRRGVGLAVGAMAMIGIALAGAAAFMEPRAHAERHQATAASAAAPEIHEPAIEDVAAAEAAPADVAADEGAAAPAGESGEADATTEDASGAAGEAQLESDYDKVSQVTLRLLNQRKFGDAEGWARRLVELEPGNAFGYRCLGSALQDLNRIKEARDVYSECVKHATKGDVYECSALGGSAKAGAKR